MTTNDWRYADQEMPPLNQTVLVRILTEAEGARNAELNFHVDDFIPGKSTVIQWKFKDNVNEDSKLQGPEQEQHNL